MTEKGLREVVAAQTKISDIDGEQGALVRRLRHRRPRRATPPSRRSCTSSITRTLPNREELDELTEFLVNERELSPFLLKLMPTSPSRPHRCRCCAPAISAACAYDPDGWDECAEAAVPQGPAADREDPDADRDVPPAAHRPGDRAAEPEAPARRELPVDAARRGARPRRRGRARHHVHPLRRPHDERIHVHGADHRLDARRHVQRDHRRDRRAEGSAARRRERGVDEDGRGDRHARQGRGVRRATG